VTTTTTVRVVLLLLLLRLLLRLLLLFLQAKLKMVKVVWGRMAPSPSLLVAFSSSFS